MLATVTSRSSSRKRWSSASDIAIAARREGMSGLQRKAAPEDGLRNETDVEALGDGVANAPGERDHVAGARPIVTHDRERMAAREADGARALTSREPGALDEPRGGELHAAVGLRPVRDPAAEACGDLPRVCGVNDRVHEERAAAPPVRVGVVEHNRFRAPDLEHALADLRQLRCREPA